MLCLFARPCLWWPCLTLFHLFLSRVLTIWSEVYICPKGWGFFLHLSVDYSFGNFGNKTLRSTINCLSTCVMLSNLQHGLVHMWLSTSAAPRMIKNKSARHNCMAWPYCKTLGPLLFRNVSFSIRGLIIVQNTIHLEKWWKLFNWKWIRGLSLMMSSIEFSLS